MKPDAIVVAAVIERDSRVLICQRRADQLHPWKWEFPGGKLEAGETPEAALRRELREELSIEASIGEVITRYVYQYPGRPPIELAFYRVASFRGQVENRVFERVVWEQKTLLCEYDFLEGDTEFVKQLARPAFTS